MPKQVIGTLTVREDYEVRESGETACNYEVYRVKKGEYPVQLGFSGGKRVLIAVMSAERVESYYVNRCFTATSVDHEFYEPGEKPTTKMWRWGDYNRTSCPPMDICGTNHRVELDDGWIVTAEYRSNYKGGRPMIWYDIAHEDDGEERGQAAC